VRAQRSQATFDDNDRFLGDAIAQSLNRRGDLQELQLRVRLTPLTTFVVRAEATQDRFDAKQERNADGYSVMPGFELRPQALISGQVFVGVRQFKTISAAVPDFTGVVASVATKYTVGATQVGLRVARDLNYSYEILQPYYALTDVGATITERITHSWDVVGRWSGQTLAYRNVSAAPGLPGTPALAARTDRSWQAGGGIGYRVGETLRLGFDLNYLHRTTALGGLRDYTGLRGGASISYGLTQ